MSANFIRAASHGSAQSGDKEIAKVLFYIKQYNFISYKIRNFISYKSKTSTETVRFDIRPHRLSSIIELLLTLSFYISLISLAIIQIHLRGLRIQLILHTLHPGQTSLPSIM